MLMKSYLSFPWMSVFLFGLSLAFFSGPLHAQDENVTVDSRDIKLEERDLPDIVLDGAEAAVDVYKEEWWAVDVKFSTRQEITEEITVKVYLEAYDFFKEEAGQPAFVVLSSEVTFINVLQGDNHHATFFLHPGSAERYGGTKGASDFGRPGEHNVRVEVLDRGRLVVEMDMNEDPNPNWFREGAPVSDVLMSVEQSPWWPVDAGQYSQIKQRR